MPTAGTASSRSAKHVTERLTSHAPGSTWAMTATASDDAQSRDSAPSATSVAAASTAAAVPRRLARRPRDIPQPTDASACMSIASASQPPNGDEGANWLRRSRYFVLA